MSSLSRMRSLAGIAVICVGIALIPLIYAGLLAWANNDPTHELSLIPAAIVNEDVQAATVDGTVQQLGVDLTEELLESDADTNFDWRVLDASDATDALESGEVLTVLTIPENFSSAAVSAGSENPSDALQAKLSIATNDGANLIIGNIAATVGEKITATLREAVSATTLEHIYVGFTEVHDSLSEAASGGTSLASGAQTAAEGSTELVLGLTQLADGSLELSTGATALAAGATTATTGAASLSQGLAALQEGASDLPNHTQSLADGAAQTAAGAAALDEGATQTAVGGTALAGSLADFSVGARQLSQGTDAALTGAQQLDDGIDALIANAEVMSGSEMKLALQQLAAGATSLVGDGGSGLTQLAASGEMMAGNASTLAGKAAELSKGADTVAAGAQQVRSGSEQVADGAGRLATGLPSLVEGIATAATGSSQLSAGMPALSSGAAQLATGASTLSGGTASAVSGATSLADGTQQLADGAEELAAGLRSGTDDVPSYSDAEAAALASVSAAPVGLEQTHVHEVPQYGYGLAPYFMALSLWVGALAFYLMMPALRPGLVAGRGSAFGAALRSFVPGVLMALVQSVLMVMIVRFAVGIEMTNLAGAIGLAALTSLTFVAINQALIALLGAPGRFVGLVMMVFQLASAGGTYPIQTAPAIFQTLSPWLPLTYPVEAFRSMIAGGSIGVAPAIRVLVCWLLGALAVTTVAVLLKRHGHRLRFARSVAAYA